MPITICLASIRGWDTEKPGLIVSAARFGRNGSSARRRDPVSKFPLFSKGPGHAPRSSRHPNVSHFPCWMPDARLVHWIGAVWATSQARQLWQAVVCSWAARRALRRALVSGRVVRQDRSASSGDAHRQCEAELFLRRTAVCKNSVISLGQLRGDGFSEATGAGHT